MPTQSTKLSFFQFVKALVQFCSTTISDIVLTICTFAFFNINNNSQAIGVCGLIDCFFMIFFGFCCDYFEPVNTLAMPFLALKNFGLYAKKIWQIGMFNLIFFVACFLLYFFAKMLIFYFVNSMASDLIQMFDNFHLFLAFSGFPFIVNNFIRGVFAACLTPRLDHQHPKRIHFPLLVLVDDADQPGCNLLHGSGSELGRQKLHIRLFNPLQPANFGPDFHFDRQLSEGELQVPRIPAIVCRLSTPAGLHLGLLLRGPV